MVALVVPQWHILRNKLFPILPVIVRPALHRWDVARPVAVARFNGRSPLQRVGTPRILGHQFAPAENGIEEVDDEQDLQEKHRNGRHSDELVQLTEVAESIEGSPGIVIATWYPGHAHVVHRPENSVRAENGAPEVNLTQCLVHIATEHLGKPVVNARKHPKESGYAHHDVKVRHDEIRIVQLDINGRVAKENTRQATRNKHGHEANGKQAGRIKPEIGAIDR